MYYNSDMAMGKRKRDRQPAMWVTMTNLPTAASHPFYRRLNQLLREHAFDGRLAAVGVLLSAASTLIDDAMTAIWSQCRDHTRSDCPSFGSAVAESAA